MRPSVFLVTSVSPFYSCKQALAHSNLLYLVLPHPFISENLSVGFVAVFIVLAGIVLFILSLIFVLIFYWQRKGSESYTLLCAYTLQRPNLHVLLSFSGFFLNLLRGLRLKCSSQNQISRGKPEGIKHPPPSSPPCRRGSPSELAPAA